MTREEREQREHLIMTIVGFGAILLIVFACVAMVAYTASTMPVVETSTNPSPAPLIEFTSITSEQIAWGIGIIVGLVILYKFFQTSIGQTFLVVLLIIGIITGVGYVFFYADKNSDGEAEPMIVGMVQMDGDNLERDKGYAEVNDTNGTANLKTVGAGFVWMVTFLVALVVISGVVIVLKRIV